MAEAAYSLDDKYTLAGGRVYLSAVQALTRLPLEQRRRDAAAGLATGGYISGYRGSPLGGYDKALWEAQAHLEAAGVVFRPAVNEDLAATAIWGTQQVHLFPGARQAGVFGIWYGKGPGVERSGDALHHANLAGTAPHGGVLMAVGDDPVCHSSTVPQQSEFALQAAGIPVLHAASVQDVYDFGLLGIAASRYSGLWVALKMTSDIAESSATVMLDAPRSQPVTPDDFTFPPEGVHIRLGDWPTFQEARSQRVRIPALHAFARANRLDVQAIAPTHRRLGIVAAGKSYADVRQALADLGLDETTARALGLAVYKVGLVWPLEPQGLRAFAAGCTELVVVEEGRAVLEPQIKDLLYALPEGQRPRLYGKQDPAGTELFPSYGELTPLAVARVLAARIGALSGAPALDARLAFLEAARTRAKPAAFLRTPYFCSGCPHNTGTRVPEGSMALAGIGCHFMAQWMDRNTVTWTHMGAEGVTWTGMAPFTDTPHMFVNLGDGTYYHSGYLAIRQAVAAGAPVTYKILYNDAVAMTGGQPVDGPISVQQIAAQVHAEGVRRIAVVSDAPQKFSVRELPHGTTLDHRDRLEAVQRELREFPGVSVLIYEQTCATEKRRRRKRGRLAEPDRRVYINERVCEGCGDCGVKSNCLSVVPIETPFGRKRAIDQSACNKDYSCLKGFCPSFVSVRGVRPARPAGVSAQLAQVPLPLPPTPATAEPYRLLIAGIGGMGVVTVSALLGTAAHLEGKASLAIDDTGLAQKFGAVYSHVQIADDARALHAARIGVAGADLILGPDLVTAASDKVLPKAAPGKTFAVVNTYEQVTGAFTRNPDLAVPGADLRATIAAAIGEEHAHFVDATRLSRALIGDTIGANLFLLGYALQQGRVPLRAESIEQAIRLNGVAVESNLAVFRWGRAYAHDRARVEAIATPGTPRPGAQSPPDLDALIAQRAADLADYQNEALAQRYRTLVARVREAERTRTPGRSGLAQAVAVSYAKLLAYKDEYEVARLYARPEFLAGLRSTFEGKPRLRFHLAPPLIAPRDPVTGELQKREYGAWMLPVFRVLARLKALRGTPLDPFGYTAERRMERRLIREYEALIEELIGGLDAERHALAVEIATLAQRMRGFGHVKERNVAAVEAREAELLAEYRAAAPERAAA